MCSKQTYRHDVLNYWNLHHEFQFIVQWNWTNQKELGSLTCTLKILPSRERQKCLKCSLKNINSSALYLNIKKYSNILSDFETHSIRLWSCLIRSSSRWWLCKGSTYRTWMVRYMWQMHLFCSTFELLSPFTKHHRLYWDYCTFKCNPWIQYI